MTTIPTWVHRIINDREALASFMEYIDTRERELLSKMRDCLQEGQNDIARVHGGESNAYKKLRQQIATYQREEEQANGIIQQG